ncbi:tetratricopeptide repeat protein [Pseudomonas guariconensis]|uniref:tetratricopeptide repeat protein n=1 Tax=Pseudomonas guariconensis TaxID=1288410 RepID=UPI0018A92F4A|nr:tetratricopeptide repeat protein [Pseudomonas guariconensis]MBF8739562.1 tetratricopeptide repeat protein [Pseudomonas guariconensis]MBF8749965.1 tetratricopeptide repeat protein [Pseudomonas guariconensis]
MACADRYDLPLSTTCETAAERYRTGVDLLLSLWTDVGQTLDQAIAADPDFALAYAARARFHAIRNEAAQAKAKIAKAAELAQVNGSERERSHVQTLSYVIHGEPAKALASALQHLDRWPLDVLIMALPLGAFGLFAFSGMAGHDQARVDLCERHAHHFPENDWWFLTCRGWAHGENGNVALGRTLTQRSLELRRNNVNGVHALAHVLYEAGANDEAGELIEDWLPGYDRSGTLHNHIAWHGALVALERDDLETALGIYAEHVAPGVATGLPINVISDTSSFLWRLQAYGHEVPAHLWADAARYASNHFRQPGVPFVDFHMAMLAAATGDQQSLQQRAAALTALVRDGKLRAGPVVPALCHAVQAFAEGRYAQCARILEPVTHDVVRIGGSGAQREIVQDTLLVSLMRAGQTQKARALLDQRLHRRPSPRDSRWLSTLAAS